jgi:hypothetical protein
MIQIALDELRQTLHIKDAGLALASQQNLRRVKDEICLILLYFEGCCQNHLTTILAQPWQKIGRKSYWLT